MKHYYFSESRRSTRAGFTIIELLVAVGITAMLVTLMLTIVTNVLNGWNRSAGSLSSGNQARTILTQLSQDLQSLVVRQDGNVWLAATVLPDTWNKNGSDWSGTAVKPTAGNGSLDLPSAATSPLPDLSTYRFGQSGMWLRFFTVRPDSNGSTDTISAPRAVSYQIVRSKVGDSTTYVYQFFRAEARPGAVAPATNSTFNSGYDLFMAAGTPSYNTADNSGGNVGSILKPATSQLIGNNVIDFGVRVWIADPAANVPKFPNGASHAGFAATTADGVTVTPAKVSPLNDGGAMTSMTYGFPVTIEVMVRILTDEGARQIANLESGKITGDWWTIALANSNVYTRRIEIKSQGF